MLLIPRFTRGMGVRSRACEQIDVLFVELLLVEVLLDLHQLLAHAGLLAGSPGKSVAVRTAMVNFDINIEFLPLGNDGGIEPGNCSKLIPNIVCLRLFGDVLRSRSGTLGDLRDQTLFHPRFH